MTREPAGEPGPGPRPAACPAPRTLRIDLEYDGERFSGWQRQATDRTVQAVLEEALSRLLGGPAPVMGAGRTDAGVHALRMTASVRTASGMPAAALRRALDAVLPEDVGILDVRDAAPGFHALRDARWKWYRYTWLASRLRRVHERRTSWRVGHALDVEAMRAGGRVLLGRHDFAAFQSSGAPRRTTVRTVFGLRLEEQGERIRLDVVADGFLYGMVRAIAGTLTEIGRGVRRTGDVPSLLASRDRARAGVAAPAHGLALVAVGYAGDDPPSFVDPSLAAALESGQA